MVIGRLCCKPSSTVSGHGWTFRRERGSLRHVAFGGVGQASCARSALSLQPSPHQRSGGGATVVGQQGCLRSWRMSHEGTAPVGGPIQEAWQMQPWPLRQDRDWRRNACSASCGNKFRAPAHHRVQKKVSRANAMRTLPLLAEVKTDHRAWGARKWIRRLAK